MMTIGRSVNGESRARRQIVLHPDVRAVLRQDVVHNRKAQTRSPAFGRKIGQEQFLLVLRSDTAARIGNHELDGIGGPPERGYRNAANE
jgi:hypothetical protein